MRLTPAQRLWFAGLVMTATVILSVLGADLTLLVLVGQPATISAWLRVDPWWYYGPAMFMLLFVLGLWVHLFGLTILANWIGFKGKQRSDS